jgi:heme A synthase
MRRLLSTRFGFFGAAALVCWAMLLVIETEHRWVAFAIGCLYAILSILFFFEERPRDRRPAPGVAVVPPIPPTVPPPPP